VSLSRLCHLVCLRVGVRKLELGQRAEWEVPNQTAVSDDLVKFGGGSVALLHLKISQATQVYGIHGGARRKRRLTSPELVRGACFQQLPSVCGIATMQGDCRVDAGEPVINQKRVTREGLLKIGGKSFGSAKISGARKSHCSRDSNVPGGCQLQSFHCVSPRDIGVPELRFPQCFREFPVGLGFPVSARMSNRLSREFPGLSKTSVENFSIS
jgi:hypothetical protein